MNSTSNRFGKILAAMSLGFSGISLANPATIVRDDSCPVIDANGVLFEDPTARLQIVSNDGGNIVATCKGQLPAEAAFPKRAIKWNEVNFGLSCVVPGDTWQMVVTPSGQSQLVCHFHS